MTDISGNSNRVRVSAGRLYIDCEIYDVYFAGLSAVILIIRDNKLHILPVQSTANGGYLLKQRNAKGDRMIDCPDVFLVAAPEVEYAMRWDSVNGALVSIHDVQ